MQYYTSKLQESDVPKVERLVSVHYIDKRLADRCETEERGRVD